VRRPPRAARLASSAALAALLLQAAAPAALAQPAPKVAFLCAVACSTLPNTNRPRDRAFLAAFEEAGFVLGRDVSLDMLGAGVGYRGLATAAAKLVERKVDLIIASGNEAVVAARQATARIPIVMLNGSDAVEEGLVKSLARPEGNVTGVSVPLGQLAAKHVQLLKEMNPRLARVSVLWSTETELHRRRLDRLERAVRPLGVDVSPIGVARFADLEKSIGAAGLGSAAGLMVLEQLLGEGARPQIALIGLRHRVVTVAGDRSFADGGGLLAYGPEVLELYRRAAVYTARILKGARPGDVPVEEPSRYELIVNQGTARALGVTIPSSILLRADQLLE
jgi:putative ABC transport system substrate-binding protein